MKLKKQLQILIKDAPKYGVSSEIMKRGVIPIIQTLAHQLKHLEYYIAQDREGSWLITTLANRHNLDQEKTVIYAFPSLASALNFSGESNSNIVPKAIPIADLLFQLFALKSVDSIIFLDSGNNLNRGKEINKEVLQNLIKNQILSSKLNKTFIPPNLA